MNMNKYIYLSLGGSLEHFYFGDIRNNAIIDIHVHVFMGNCFNFYQNITRSGMMRL